MDIYTHLWLYRKNYANTNQTELCKRSSQSCNPTLGCAQSHALYHINQQKADLAQSLLSVPPGPWRGRAEERVCLCLKHKWLLHRNSRCQVKLLKMSMEMKKETEKQTPYTFWSNLVSHHKLPLSLLPVAAKLPRPWELPGHGNIRGSLAWGV